MAIFTPPTKTRSFVAYAKKTWQISKPYFQSENKKRIWLHLATVISLNLLAIYMLVLLNQWYQAFYNALEKKDTQLFWLLLGKFLLLAAIFVISAVYRSYLTQKFQLNWRKWMSEQYICKWTDKNNFYRLELARSQTNTEQSPDNPDQRIQEDIDAFTRQTLSLTIGLFDALVTLAAFLFILWNLSSSLNFSVNGFEIAVPGLMVWATLIYCIVGTWFAHLIGKRLIQLNFAQQKKEALFRHHLIRVREYSETIALDKGAAFEQKKLIGRLQVAVDNYRELIKAVKNLTWFTTGFAQVAVIFPMIIAGPRYLSGAISLGALMQIIQAFNRTQDNMSWIVSNYSDLAGWRATTDRLLGFDSSISHLEKSVDEPHHDSQKQAALKQVRIQLPTQETLFKDLTFTIQAGDAILIQGPSGTGKSTLLRVLSGIWPYIQGEIECPKNTAFIPQKPYIMSGTLRDVLLYPSTGYGRYSDNDLKQALEDALLPELTDHLNQGNHWGQRLSLGEQQRIAFARIFLQKPAWVFADEATSALDHEREKTLYARLAKLIREQHGALVSIAHRQSLTQFHHLIWQISLDQGEAPASRCQLAISPLKDCPPLDRPILSP